VATLFRCFPPVILGGILLFGGLELAAGGRGGANNSKEDRYIIYLTAGLAMWNMGVAYLVGLLLAIACERKWVRL